MTSESLTSSASTSDASSLDHAARPVNTAAHQSKSGAKRRSGLSQERVMVMFTLFFALGILLWIVTSEAPGVRGIAMAIYSVSVFWAMFRFGI